MLNTGEYFEKIEKLMAKRKNLAPPTEKLTTGTAFVIFRDYLEAVKIVEELKKKPLFVICCYFVFLE
jgi:hypothetical protein